MTFFFAMPFAKSGGEIRRTSWPAGRTLTYSAGPGSQRSVAVLITSGVVSVVKNTDFGQAEFAASDWVRAYDIIYY